MGISWGYSPKIEKLIPLGNFPVDSYLLVARQAMENLGWKIGHISERGIIAYTPVSFQSYSEEVSVRFENNFALVKSECIGIQLLFTDYGKNALNLEKFFHEFEYVEFYLKEIWDESLMKLRSFVADQDPEYFDKAPLTIKNKIKNVFYLFIPRSGYLVTPILIYLNVIYFLIYLLLGNASVYYNGMSLNEPLAFLKNIWMNIFANNRALVFNGQVWRLFTYQFVHLHFLHIFFNMYALVYIGLMVEHKLTSKKFALIYLISGVCGGLTSIMMHDIGLAVGASGAIMGVFGAFLALLLSHVFERHATRALLISTGIVTTFMLLNGMRGNTDNAAHIGGLISGFVLTYLWVNEKFGNIAIKLNLRYVISLGLVVGFTVMVWLFTPNFHSAQFDELAEQFAENSKQYHQVSEIPNDLSTLQKMKMAREYGMDLWDRNGAIVQNMMRLKLDQEHKRILDHYKEITAKTIRLEYVRYKLIQTKNPDAKKRLDELTAELIELRAKAKKEVGLEFPAP